eukprot:Sdes_comp16210_c0_seq1m5475
MVFCWITSGKISKTVKQNFENICAQVVFECFPASSAEFHSSVQVNLVSTTGKLLIYNSKWVYNESDDGSDSQPVSFDSLLLDLKSSALELVRVVCGTPNFISFHIHGDALYSFYQVGDAVCF